MNGNHNRQGNNYGSFGGYNSQGNNNGNFGGFNGQGNNNGNFGGSNGQGNNNGSFGGNNPPQYNPYEPMYKPENSYDPNAPLYTPSQNSYTSATMTPPKSKTNLLAPIIILVAIAVGIGVFFYIKNRQITISEYANTASGQRELADTRREYGDMYKDDGLNFDVYITDNNEFVFEYSYIDYQDFTPDELSYFKEYLDATLEEDRAEYEKIISETMHDNNVAEFSIMYRVRNSDGTLLYEYTIGLSHS